MKPTIIWLILSTCYLSILGQSFNPTIHMPIGGLFNGDDDEQELAFSDAIAIVNSMKTLYPYVLEARFERIPIDDDFVATQTVCSMLSHGVAGIFGPTQGISTNHIQSICDTKEIPHIGTHLDVPPQRGTCFINLYPHVPVLAHAFVAIVREWGWKSFTILYEDRQSLPRINELLKMYDTKGPTITIRQLSGEKNDFRHVFYEVKKAQQTHFVVDCSIKILEEVLRQAQQVGLMSDHHNYIITNLDLHSIDLEPYQYGGANITGFRMVDPLDEDVNNKEEALQVLKQKLEDTCETEEKKSAQFRLRLETALMYDAVNLFAAAIKQLSETNRKHPKPLFCNSTDNWEHGYSIINFMKMHTMRGLTGNIRFDHQGFRSEFCLDIVELSQKGLKKVGTWNSTDGLNISRYDEHTNRIYDEHSLVNKSFVILTALTDPYGMLKETSQKLIGNDRFEGFGIDLIHELSEMLGFNYTFRLQEDSNYGTLNPKTKQWNGMVKELMEHRADLAIADLTITSERESAVDFTMPFMNLGISILYKKPVKLPPSLFSFLDPFSKEVWLYLGVAYFTVSLMLFIMGRLCPAEWTNPYPCVQEPEFYINQFSIKNSFWFTVGSLMQQGSEIAPIAVSTRMVAGMWWFFTLIMVSSYTANLAAFLTVESLVQPFKNIEELASQDVIKYGAKRGGATATYFRDSNYSIYKKIWDYMENNPEQMTPTNPAGVIRVEQENYAFLMESTSIEYTIERHCTLAQIGGLLDDKGYGIMMRKNSPYRNKLSQGVLKLQESGKLTSLKIKWWKEKRGGGSCSSEESKNEALDLGLDNVGGVFVVLVVGVAAAFLLVIVEGLIAVAHRSVKDGVSFKEELISELRFIFRCKGLTKTVRNQKSESIEGSAEGDDDDGTFAGEEYSPTTYGFIPEVTKKSPLP